MTNKLLKARVIFAFLWNSNEKELNALLTIHVKSSKPADISELMIAWLNIIAVIYIFIVIFIVIKARK